MTEPSNAELVRRLEEAVSAIRSLTQKVELSYVRKDVYEAHRESDHRRVGDVEADVAAIHRQEDEKEKADTAFRRQVVLAFTVGGVGWLVTLALAIVSWIGK